MELGDELTADGGVGWPLTETLQLRIWWARVSDGNVTGSTDHDRLRWVGAADLDELDWLPADGAIVDRLRGLLRAA